MKVLIINSGSSSVKYQVIDTEKKDFLAKGLVESIGLDRSKIKHEKRGSGKISFDKHIPDHHSAIENTLALLVDKEHGVLKSYDDDRRRTDWCCLAGERPVSVVLPIMSWRC